MQASAGRTLGIPGRPSILRTLAFALTLRNRPMTAAAFDVLSLLDPPLWLVTAQDGERRGGLIATLVKPASIVPRYPRMLVGLAQQHFTHELVTASRHFVLHLLGEEQLDLVWRFALDSGRTVDKLAGLEVRTTATGCPCVTAALAWLECRVESEFSIGDRTLYVAEVLAAGQERLAPLLTQQRMLKLATPEQRQALQTQMAQDRAFDSARIEAWRQHRA